MSANPVPNGVASSMTSPPPAIPPETEYQQQAQTEAIPLTRCPHLYLLPHTPKGRGVFTSALLPAQTHLESSPILLLPLQEVNAHFQHTVLNHYTYVWPEPHAKGYENGNETAKGSKVNTQALILGLGSLFNHSAEPNVGWFRDLDRQVVVYKTLRDVKEREELCISYGGPGRLTFVDVDAENETSEERWEDGLGRLDVDGI